MNYDDITPIKVLQQESEKFSISSPKKYLSLNNQSLLTGWEDSQASNRKDLKKPNFPLHSQKSSKRPRTMTPITMKRKRNIDQRKFSAEENVIHIEVEDCKKDIEKFFMGGFFSITPKMKNFMFSLNKAKIRRMKETLEKRKESFKVDGSIRINSVSPFSRLNTNGDSSAKVSRKNCFSRGNERIGRKKSIFL